LAIQQQADGNMAKLTSGELQVMRILWEYGESKPGEIQSRFPTEIKNPALRSYLTILVEKGHVTRRREGKAFYYRAKTRQQTVFRSSLRDLIETFCEGSAKELMFNLIKTEKLSDDDLRELRELAEEEER